MEVTSVPISSVLPYPGNPRRNDAAVQKVARSITEFGFRQPIVVDPDMVVIVGHTRLLAAARLGLAEVPVHVARGLSEAQVRAYRLADNRTHEEAEWDLGKLAEELAGLKSAEFDLSLTGFDSDELDELLKSVGETPQDPDVAPALEAEARTATGDVWVLGPHRVVCGDATDPAALHLALRGAAADAVWTDPPYNVAYKGKAGKIANDDLGGEEFLSFLRAAFVAMFASMKPGAAIYVAHADTEGARFRQAFADAGLKLSGVVIWRKDALVLGRSDYQWQHEPILYGWKPGSAHRWYGGRKQTTLTDLGGGPFAKLPDGRWQIVVGDRILIVSGDAVLEEAVPSIFTEDRPRKNADHPTMKPTALIERMLRNNARPGDLVLDPFGGSGSTLVAADRLGMVAAIVELDPCYTDVIVKRWQELSGRKAFRESDGAEFDTVAPQMVSRAA